MEPSKQDLLEALPGTIDTDRLRFVGMRGDGNRHLAREALEAALAALPPAPRNEGSVDLMVARGTSGERHLPKEALLTVERGMPGDRWAEEGRYGREYQLATTRTDFARVIANGQALELHGDNLFLTLDLSDDNLPAGSLLALGAGTVQVTPQAHNGCKKWVQRFGLAPMQLNMERHMRPIHLRGIYLQVVAPGLVQVGDRVRVLRRGP